MSETPRTEAVIRYLRDPHWPDSRMGGEQIVSADLARTLELELAQRTAEITAYRKTHRWNVREDEDGTLLVCKGGHDSADSCNEVRYAPLLSS